MRVLVGVLLIGSGLSKGAQAPNQETSVAAAPATTLKLDVADGSVASYHFQEQFPAVKSPDEASGSSSAITGSLVLAPDGSLVPGQSKFSIDLRSLKSDQEMRDAYIQKATLETDKFPTADFVPRRIQGINRPLPETGQTTFHLIGDLTIHGVTKEVTWNGTAAFSEYGAVIHATTDFIFGTFDLSKPRLMHVLNVDDKIHLEIAVKAKFSRATATASPVAPGIGHGFLIDKHLAVGMQCDSCHVASPPPTPPTMNTCLSCHGGTYSKLAEMTDRDTPNPHDSPHQAEIPCAMCHHVHKASELHCNECHSLDLKTP
jgi:polyisoprenoid-binding protein YceI